MGLGVGDGSARATTTRGIEMQMINKLCSTLSVLENAYFSVENRCSISTFRSSMKKFCIGKPKRREGETRGLQRVELGSLPSVWRSGSTARFSCVPPYWLVPALLPQRHCHLGSQRRYGPGLAISKTDEFSVSVVAEREELAIMQPFNALFPLGSRK